MKERDEKPKEITGREAAKHAYNCDCDNCVTDRWQPPNVHRTGDPRRPNA